MAQITMGIYWGILCSASCILFLGEVVYNLVFRLQKWRKKDGYHFCNKSKPVMDCKSARSYPKSGICS